MLPRLLEQLERLVHVAAFRGELGESGERQSVVWTALEHGPEPVARALDIAQLHVDPRQRVRRGAQRGDVGGGRCEHGLEVGDRLLDPLRSQVEVRQTYAGGRVLRVQGQRGLVRVARRADLLEPLVGGAGVGFGLRARCFLAQRQGEL